MRRVLGWALLVVGLAAPATGQEIPPADNDRDEQYYTESEARDKIYGDDLSWTDTLIRVDARARAELTEAVGPVPEDSVVRLVYARRATGELEAVYRVASEVGKYNPFDFVVGLDANLAIRRVIVLNYRESRGGDVRRRRFLGQFDGKSIASPVRLNRDIIGISGATLSSAAVTRGVKKTLFWAERVWGGKRTDS